MTENTGYLRQGIYELSTAENPPNWVWSLLVKSSKRQHHLQPTTNEMEFPPNWDVFPMADFDTAAPRDPGELGMELMVQVRANGRMLDNFRVTLGGTEIITAKVAVSGILADKETPDWVLVYAVWPRDVGIRRNMTTSAWLDIKDLIQSNDARMELPEGTAIGNEEVITYLEGLTDKTVSSSSLRWAVCVGEDNRPALVLQALPGPAHTFAGKPTFKG